MQTPLSSLSLLSNAPESEQDNCLIASIKIGRRYYSGSDQMHSRTSSTAKENGKKKLIFNPVNGRELIRQNYVSFPAHSELLVYVSGGVRIKGNEQSIRFISIIIVNYFRMVVYYARISSH